MNSTSNGGSSDKRGDNGTFEGKRKRTSKKEKENDFIEEIDSNDLALPLVKRRENEEVAVPAAEPDECEDPKNERISSCMQFEARRFGRCQIWRNYGQVVHWTVEGIDGDDYIGLFPRHNRSDSNPGLFVKPSEDDRAGFGFKDIIA